MSYVLIALAAFAVPLIHITRTLGHDWDYFNALSWLVRTNLVHYQELNVYDPWGCGGLDVWANPQHRMLSPLGLLDLVLPPHVANLTGLIIHAALGALGAYTLFRRLNIAHPQSLVCAFLFINSSWFALHYAAGHIPFGGMQLIPWAAVFALDFEKKQLHATLFFAFLILDGGIYAAIFSGYLMLTLWCIHGFPRLRIHLLMSLVAIASATLVKVIPILAATGRGPIRTDASVVGPALLLRMFFDPRQFSGEEYLFEHLRFHEFGCYIGVPFLIALKWKHLRPYATAIGIWLWAATAWLTPFNPWSIHRVVPFVNLAHVQSRALLLVFLLLLIALGLSVRWRWLLALLVIESVGVRIYTWEQSFRHYPGQVLPMTPIAKTNITHTVLTAEKPGQYMREGEGVHNCYEPSLKHEGRITSATAMGDYRGEAWVFGPEVGPPVNSGTATLLEYIPARIRLRYEMQEPGIIVLNTRSNGGWVTSHGEIVPHERVAIRVADTQGELTLRYRPAYRPYQLVAAAVALLAFCATAWVWRRRVSV